MEHRSRHWPLWWALWIGVGLVFWGVAFAAIVRVWR